jgi:putative hydrolase of the HAD superfamily
MIDTVTFDLWNTLLVNAPPDMEKYRFRRVENIVAILRKNGYQVSSEEILEAYRMGFEKCKETWRRNLDLSTQQQLHVMFGFLSNVDLKEITESLMTELTDAYVSPILEDPPELIRGAANVLEELKRNGYKIGLICNTGTTPGKTIRMLLERLGILRYFHTTTFSNELGIRKPDPRIFLHTLNDLGSKVQNSLHVGDLIDVDILGARNMGMVAVHLNSNRTCFEETSPGCYYREIPPDYSIGTLEDLMGVLDILKYDLR